MKKIFGNFWVQIFVGLIIGIIGMVISGFLALVFAIRYSGFLFSSGDRSPITNAISIIFAVLAFTFPALVRFCLYKFGKLKIVSKKIRTIVFFIFVPLPLWIALGYVVFAKRY